MPGANIHNLLFTRTAPYANSKVVNQQVILLLN